MSKKGIGMEQYIADQEERGLTKIDAIKELIELSKEEKE